MTVRQFIQMLMKEVENLDEQINFSVYAKHEVLEKIIEDDWCLDEYLDVERLDDNGATCHVILEEVEY